MLKMKPGIAHIHNSSVKRQKQVDRQGFKASGGYKSRARPAWAMC